MVVLSKLCCRIIYLSIMFIEKITPEASPENDVFADIPQLLAEHGWCVTPRFLSPQLINQLAGELRDGSQAGDFHQAGIGRGADHQIDSAVRTDRVCWLDSEDSSPAQREYLNLLESLRLSLNRSLFLGLFEFEGHMALYPPGSYYRKHLDQFKGVEQRIVTCILYLNQDWQVADGGQLRLYTDPDNPSLYEEILPIGGQLVSFFSARFLHEVMPARRDRQSITGWFKTRQSPIDIS